MDPIAMLKQHHEQLADLQQKFDKFVQITISNFKAVQTKLGQQDMEIAGLKAALQQRGTPSAMNGAPVNAPTEEEVVGSHPVTGAPVTRAMLAADPKLKLRMMFSETDA